MVMNSMCFFCLKVKSDESKLKPFYLKKCDVNSTSYYLTCVKM